MSKKNFDLKIKSRPFINDSLQNAIPIDASITIAASAGRIFEFWRDVNNLPKFLSQITSISAKSDRVSHWTWKALNGAVEIKWESEIIAETKGKHLAWRSLEGTSLAHAGEILLRPVPHKNETELHLHLDYAPPGGKITDFLSHILGEAPAVVLKGDLRRLRQLIEVGYLSTIEGQPMGCGEPKKESSKSNKEQK